MADLCKSNAIYPIEITEHEDSGHLDTYIYLLL
jgi:hypothetical protein